jgi:hypothetical protein
MVVTFLLIRIAKQKILKLVLKNMASKTILQRLFLVPSKNSPFPLAWEYRGVVNNIFGSES